MPMHLISYIGRPQLMWRKAGSWRRNHQRMRKAEMAIAVKVNGGNEMKKA